MALPSLCSNEVAVDYALLVNPTGTSLFHLKPNITVTGKPTTGGNPGGDQNLYAVADRKYPLALLIEFPGKLQ